MEKQQIIKETDIAVIGIGFRFPGDESDVEKFWKNLRSGFDAVKEIPSERYSKNYSILGEISSSSAALLEFDEWKNFDPLFFGIAPSEASTIDPQGRLSLMCTYESLEDAYLDPVELRGSDTSIFIGCYTMDYQFNLKDRTNGSPNIFNSNMHYLANRVSYCFDFRGQSVTMDTACSSSSNAIISGIQSIINGSSALSICGGTNFIIDPFTSKMLSTVNMAGKTGKCMSFDEKCDGFARSEGCGMVVLKRLTEAIKDGNKIYCVIKGYSSNVDGNEEKTSLFAPSINGQYDNLLKTFKSANGTVLPIDIDYVEAHGTGTPVGDPVEVESISLALKTSTTRSPSSPLLIGSLKSNIGHTESASGVASLIKCCLMFKHRLFTPNANFNAPNPAIKFKEWNIKVVTEPIEFPNDKQVSMILNNFGATASNTCFILSEFIHKENDKIPIMLQQDKEYLIPFSANSKKSLESYKQIIFNNFKNKIDFNDFLIKQIYTKTNKLNQRSVIISKSDWSGFNQVDEHYSTVSSKSFNIITKPVSPIIVFIFSGQGPQYNKMGIELYENEPIFRESMNEIDNLFKPYFGYSVLEKLRSIKDDDKYSINLPSIILPPLLMIQISLFKLLKHWGIDPSFIIGHSFGELAMAYTSGMIDLDSAVKIVYIRSKLQEKTTGSGKMLSITMSKDQYNEEYSNKYPSIEIACFNSQNSIVLSGNEKELIEISNQLNEKSIQNVFLGAISSLHSSSQTIIKDELISMEPFKCYKAKVESFSTVTSKLFNQDFTFEYVYRNIREPVQFETTINNLYNHIESNNIGNGSVVFIEISPHPVLSYYLNQLIPNDSNFFTKDSILILQTLNRKKKNDVKEIQKTISKLYCHGYSNINFKCQFNENNNNNLNCRIISKSVSIELPRYQWDLQAYWSETKESLKSRIDGAPINIIGNSNDLPFISKTTFIDIKKEPFNYLKGHQVKDLVYFPGCGYIDNILNLFPNQDLIINYLEFNSPFILMEGENLEMTSNLIKTSVNQYKATFNIRDKKTNQWNQTSNGNISIYKNEMISPLSSLSFKDIESFINDKFNFCHISKPEFYQHVKKITSINYQNCFQRVQDCWIGNNNSSLIKVSTKQLISKNDNQFLNASILDCCFHGFLCSITDPCVIVFDKVENFRIYSSNIPTGINKENQEEEEIFIYVLSKPKSKYSDSFSGELIAFLENGKILFEVEHSVCTSLIPVSNSLMIEYPNDELFSFQIEPKDSQIPNLQQFKYLYDSKEYQVTKLDGFEYGLEILPNFFFNFISQRTNISKEIINNSSIDQLIESYTNENNLKHSRLLKFVLNTIKSKVNLSKDYLSASKGYLPDILIKTTKIISKLLFPLDSDDDLTDTPQSLFENQFLDNIYSKLNAVENNLILISKIISDSIKGIINKKCVVRILEIGGGTASLSENVIFAINKLLVNNKNVNVLIEFTFTDISSSFIPDAKQKLFNIIKNIGHGSNSGNISLLFKTFDLEKSFLEQNFKPSYYDFIIFSNVLHVVKDIGFGLNQIYNLLSTNGHLIFIEPPLSLIIDSIFGCFDQWWSFTDTEIRGDRCCMNQDKWMELLPNYGFIESLTSNSHNSTVPFIIHTQKQKLVNYNTPPLYSSNSDFNILIYTGTLQNESSIASFSNLISNLLFSKNCKISIISTIKEFEQQVEYLPNDEKSIIFFIAPIIPLEFKNFNQVSLELYLIGRSIWNINKTNIKIATISIDSTMESKNYLNSSVLGIMKYFQDSPITVFSFDFDNESFNNDNTVLSILNSLLLNSKNHIQNEFIIRDNKVYTERIYREEIKKSFSNKIDNQKVQGDQLYARLNLQLQYELKFKPILKDDEFEIKILATGINMKDHLNYQGLIPKEMSLGKRNIDDKISGFGGECSGIITKVGNKVTEFKVGDHVFGMAYPATSSHVILNSNSNCIVLKPSNITHAQAASIPLVYLSSYLSIFKIGNLDIEENESILIHSASGGVGLSALEILKWKGHKSFIFVTAGSIEKQQFLIEKYGSFITGIYSTRNTNYVNEIKLKLNELGSDKEGVDVILNTLSSNEFIDANFKCLNQGGRIIDLSITHLSHSNHTDFNKFKYFFGYHSFELGFVSNNIMKKTLKLISEAVSNNQLNLIDPITIYPVENIKDAIESFSNRTHIGKIVVEINKDLVASLNSSNTSFIINNHKVNNDFGKTILVTGQIGIILEILKWIVSNSSNNSIENIIVLSFSELKWELKLLINQTIEKFGGKIKFYFKSVDVGNYKSLNLAIDQIFNENKENLSLSNVNSIFHFAFKSVLTKLTEITVEDFEISNSTKAIGAINFHNISLERGWDIKNFILSSSVASVVINVGSPAYVSANNILDSLSRYRKSIGLPCTTINIGLILSTGIVTNLKSTSDIIETKGIRAIKLNLLYGFLDLILGNDHKNRDLYHNAMICDFNFNTSKPFIEGIKFSYKFDYYTNQIQLKNNLFENSDSNDTVNILIKIISELLSIEPSLLNTDIKLSDYGADSLISTQFKILIDKQFYPNILTLAQIQSLKIKSSIQIIIKSLNEKQNQKKNLITEIDSTSSSMFKLISAGSSNSNKVKMDLEFWKNEIKFNDYDKSTASEASSKLEMDLIESPTSNQRVLITGTTGYLGIYMLYHLIKLHNCSIVYCTVRNSNSKEIALNKVIENLKYHKLYDNLNQEHLNKIQVLVISDLSDKWFGLQDELKYQSLSESVNLIIHCAANTSLTTDYSEAKETNVGSLKELIQFAFNKSIKRFVNYSSITVFYNDYSLNNQFDENVWPKLEHQSNLAGYQQSKVVGELIQKDASLNGLPSILIRPPSISCNPETGIGNKNDGFLLFIQCCFIENCIPNIIPHILFIVSPINWIAENSMNLIFNNQSWDQPNNLSVYNLHSNSLKSNELIDFIKSINGKNSKIELVEYDVWKSKIQNSKHEICKRYTTFHTLEFNYSYSEHIKLSENTKSILVQKNQKTFEQVIKEGQIQKYMIDNHLNFIFNK